jgi:hypothetical protein
MHARWLSARMRDIKDGANIFYVVLTVHSDNIQQLNQQCTLFLKHAH